MCELLAMSANVPTDICFSFSGLIQRGGKTGPHSDGWGITFYEGKGSRHFKDPHPSCNSKIAEMVKNYPIKSCAVISHIRQANVGEVCLENTHPFTRELWGFNWTYAHNGQMANYEHLDTGRHRPVGTTDSEFAFCWILEQLEREYPNIPTPDDMPNIIKKIAGYCDQLGEFGVFNMILTNGDYVMAYCTNHLYWITRRAPFGSATLIDEEMSVDFQRETTPNDVVTVIATQPLTKNECWHRMKPKEFGVFKLGELVLDNIEALKDVDYAPPKEA